MGHKPMVAAVIAAFAAAAFYGAVAYTSDPDVSLRWTLPPLVVGILAAACGAFLVVRGDASRLVRASYIGGAVCYTCAAIAFVFTSTIGVAVAEIFVLALSVILMFYAGARIAILSASK